MTGLPRSFNEGTERTELCRGCMEVSLPVSPPVESEAGHKSDQADLRSAKLAA